MSSNHVLDNPCWYALTGHHAHLATGTPLAMRYLPDIFGAVAVVNHSDDAFRDMTALIDGDIGALFEAHPPEAIPGWQITATNTADQRVCQQDVSVPPDTGGIIELTAADVPDMLKLIDIARPGPFMTRTIEMGRYIGIRQAGQLVAMAGERLRLPGYTEISAVCTHPDWQGKGFARRLCSLLIHANWKNNVVPYLHLNPENTPALRLYESLHFTKRTDMKITVISRE